LATFISDWILILWEELQFSGVSQNGLFLLMFEMYLFRISVYTEKKTRYRSLLTKHCYIPA